MTDYYTALGLSRTASQQQIKQAYKKLALKHHPDKNEDKVTSKAIFTKITEAYSILNDPNKRKRYDEYGNVEQMDAMGDFEGFMEDYAMFEEFLGEFLAFDDFGEMAKFTKKIRSKKAGRAKGRTDHSSINMMNNLFGSVFKTKLFDKEPSEQEQESDNQDLTQQQTLLLQFGQRNITTNKKKCVTCNLDGKKIKSDEILLHFSQMHQEEFKTWNKVKQDKPSC